MVIDPDTQQVLDLVKQTGRPPFEQVSYQEARALYQRSSALLQPEASPVAETRELAAPGPAGAVPLRFYRGADTQGAAVLPALIFFHGGGWVIGDLQTHDFICRRLANAARCIVIAVDYRLAPEHKFPAGVEDCAAATVWIAAQAASLGIDAARLAVGGDSAGGNLAAVMAHMARDGNLPSLCFQLLIYPSVDQRLGQDSYRRVTSGVLLTTNTVRYFQGHYLRGDADKSDWRASPLLAEEFSGLPPALIVTAAHDPLCDEGQEYARKLEQNGGRVTLLRFGDQLHGFVQWSKLVRAGAGTIDFAASQLRAAFSA